MTTTLLALAVTGATYTLDWQTDDLHLTGTIDTQTDTLTWSSLPEDWVGESLVWPAVTRGERLPTGEVHYEIVPYDVPDDFSGVLDEWGFLSDAQTQVMNVTMYAGLGCSMGQWLCLPNGFCTGQNLKFAERTGSQWTIAEMHHVFDYQDYTGVTKTLGPARVNLTPVSPTRAVGDVNWDGLFNSGDLVTVFGMGKFETGESAFWTEGDWDQNGVFDSGDMVAAFVGGAYEQQVSVVPEPSAVVLLLLGMVALRRKR